MNNNDNEYSVDHNGYVKLNSVTGQTGVNENSLTILSSDKSAYLSASELTSGIRVNDAFRSEVLMPRSDLNGSIRLDHSSVMNTPMWNTDQNGSWSIAPGILNIAPLTDFQIAKPEIEKEQLSKAELLELFKKQEEVTRKLYTEYEKSNKQSTEIIEMLRERLEESDKRTRDEILLMMKGGFDEVVCNPLLHYVLPDLEVLKKFFSAEKSIRVFCPMCNNFIRAFENAEDIQKTFQKQQENDWLNCKKCKTYRVVMLWTSGGLAIVGMQLP